MENDPECNRMGCLPDPRRKQNQGGHPVTRTAAEAIETREWQDSLDYVVQRGGGVARAAELLRQLDFHSRQSGYRLPFTANTPYVNSIPAAQQPPFPGNQVLERRIKSLVRWNALSMVVRANKLSEGIGAIRRLPRALLRSGLRATFKGQGHVYDGEVIFFRAMRRRVDRGVSEGRLPVANSRTSVANSAGGGFRYRHPWLMPISGDPPCRWAGPHHGDL